MGRKKIEHTDTFEAVGENDSRLTIHVFTNFIEVTPLDAEVSWLQGMKVLRTSRGDPVNMLSDGTFLDLMTGRIFRADWKP